VDRILEHSRLIPEIAVSNPQDALSSLSPLKRALLALDDMKARLDAAEGAKTEPIAVVGMGCRFPGAGSDPEGFWQLLRDGVDAVREVPRERWDVNAYYDPRPDVPGKAYGRWGAFVEDVDRFDPQFFGIAPREAAGIDPQQRLLLEVTWEALEQAGIAPDRLSGTSTGVFIGICSIDYAALQLQTADLACIDAYSLSGTAHSIAAGRLAYVLGLQGPALAVDTACSSSLVAVHLACQSLRNEDCRMAITGGVHVTLSPLNSVVFSRLRMLAADGRCKTFDARGDGFVEGEGCGVLVLKRLSTAMADGDQILALIRGSAVNQDGASSGLTAPNGPAQEAVIRAALQRAGVRPAEVGYVEAHGTGTSLGDPIEVQALASVLGEGRASGQPLLIGSVKTNIGHTQAAAGIAGLLKLVLALRHEEIPASLHLQEPNPYIPWVNLPVQVATERRPWPRGEQRRIGGVSSFGFSGTNVHVVVEEPPVARADQGSPERPLHIVTLSARTDAVLSQLARRWETHLAQNSAAPLADVAYTANAGRAHLPYRAVMIAQSLDQLSTQLAAVGAGTSATGLVRSNVAGADRPRIAFLFTGQGAQYVGMGRELYETQPTFRRALDRCAEHLRDELDQPLLSVLYPENDKPGAIDQTGYAQPALFALEYALTELWKSWGVTPGAVLGHSVGEYVAACVAGVFSLEDALKLISARGRLMQSLPAGGAMAAVFAPEARVREALERRSSKLSIAAINGPESVVVSGAEEPVAALLAQLESEGIGSERLRVSHAFHSALMEPILPEFEQVASTIQYHAQHITLVSNLTGRAARREIGAAAYWRNHLREPVRFGDGINALYASGYRIFVEIGPRPTLSSMARRALPDDAVWLPSLRKPGADWQQMLDSLAQVYAHGVELEWAGFDRDYVRRKRSLPTYPFQRERHWISTPPQASRNVSRRSAADTSAHPLLGTRLSSALTEIQFEAEISTRTPAFLDDHRKRGEALLPATAFLEIGVAAARAALGGDDYVFEDLAITEPLLLDENPVTIQTVLTPEPGGGATFRLFSREVAGEGEADAWRLHAAGALRLAEAGVNGGGDSLETARARCGQEIPVEEYYARLLADGHEYGPGFRGMSRLWRGSNEALALIELPEVLRAEASAYRLHPALLDAALQLLGAGLPDSAHASSRGDTYLPVSLGRFRVFAGEVSRAWSHVSLRPSPDATEFSADVHLYDHEGRPIAEILDVYLRRASMDALQRAGQPGAPQLYEQVWRETSNAGTATGVEAPALPVLAGTWIILGEDDDVSRGLSQRLQERGASVVLVTRAGSYDAAGSRVLMDPGNPAHAIRMLEDARAAHGCAIAGLVHLWSLGADDVGAPDVKTRLACESLLHLVQAISVTGDAPRPRLAVVTRGAAAVAAAAREIAVGQAPVWGLARTIVVEHAELRCVCVDLDPQRPAVPGEGTSDPDLIADAISRSDAEHQVAYRDSRRYVARLVRSAVSSTRSGASAPEPVALETGARGMLDRLELRPAARRAPEPGEIEVRVAAAGLNFRDVLNALGMYEGEPGPLGSECVGTVVTTAPDVTHVKIGDTVLGMAAGGLRTYVTAPAGAFIAKPDRLSIDEAATVPVTFLTAEYALNRLAQMKPGQRVLIHAAAGGVGLAAVQLAQRAGAEIIATAGSPEKHDYLHSLGVEHVFSSRTLDFAAQIHALTGGEGVDIVLNSLAGDFIDRSVSTLRKGGCFLEIGKAGIWTHDQMAAVRPDVSYFPIYLGNVELEIVQQMLRELMDAFASKRLTPLPLRRFTLNEAADAFRYMAQAKHIGKIVISVEEGTAGPCVRDDASYLITGGLGALGLHLARQLVDRGARHLMLAGRSGPSPEAAQAISELEAAGADVFTAQADVSREPDVAALLATIHERMPPLAGIIHAAGVLDDGVLAEQTWPRFANVLVPKLAGAWNLHRLTEGLPLDFFVMFSSMASLLGGPGQGSYAAANAFLDALAHHRRARGLPALSINWGPWAGIGMAAGADERDHRRWREGGLGLIQPREAMAMLEPLLKNQPAVAQLAVLPIDWATLLRRFPSGQEPRFFSELAASLSQVRRTAPSPAARRSLAQELESVAPGRRRALLEARLRAEAVKVLGLAPEAQLDPRRPLREIGLDSLMAVELRNAVAEALGRTLPSTLLFKYPTLEALFEFAVAQLPAPPAEAVSSHPPTAGDADAADVDALTDDEARELLSNELQSLAGAWPNGSLT
jgi:acyl transferase domain-containing protein/acyl carrier protein